MGILCDGATGFSSLMQGPEKGVNFLTIRVTFKFSMKILNKVVSPLMPVLCKETIKTWWLGVASHSGHSSNTNEWHLKTHELQHIMNQNDKKIHVSLALFR
jgi:hypothetical protein